MSPTIRTFSTPSSAASRFSGLIPRAAAAATTPALRKRPRRLTVSSVISTLPDWIPPCPLSLFRRRIWGHPAAWIIPLNEITSMPDIPVARQDALLALVRVEAGMNHELLGRRRHGRAGHRPRAPLAPADGVALA